MQFFRLKPSSSPLPKGLALVGAKWTPGMPGIKCVGMPRCCGTTWANNSSRLRVELPPSHFLNTMRGWPIEPPAFMRLADTVRSTLNLSDDVALLPGTDIGYQRVEARGPDIPDFAIVDIRTMIISQGILQSLTVEGITGWHAEQVEFVGKIILPPSEYWELVVHGRGGAALTSPEPRLLSCCPVCGREEYERGVLHRESLSEYEWDGSDFFRFDPPKDGPTYATKRVKEFFERHGLLEAEFEEPIAIADSR